MLRNSLRCEVLESRDAMSATIASLGGTDPVETVYQGSHILYQDVFIPSAQSNQGWGQWEVNMVPVLR
jgi:hypothetical protein